MKAPILRIPFQIGAAVAALAVVLPSTPAADVEAYSVFKGHYFTQSTSGAPVETPFMSYGFEALVVSDPDWMTSAEVRIPSGFTMPLDDEDENGRAFLWHPFQSSSELNSFYGNGTYTLTIDSEADDVTAAQFSLGAAAYPTETPRVTNLDAAQEIDADADFDLQWNTFASATGDDHYRLEIVEPGSGWVIFTSSGTGSSVVVPGGTLDAETEYDAKLRFIRPTMVDLNSYPGAIGSAGFFNETQFTMSTGAGGTGGEDETPPVLFLTSPANGATGVATDETVRFTFSEPMDPSFISVEWSDNLNSAAIAYSWSNPQTLVATYTPGFPLNEQVSWVLNPTDTDPNNLRDLAGNELPPAIFQGSFRTGEGDPCDGGGGNTDMGAISLGKTAHYVQASDAAPIADPEIAALFSVFYRPEVNVTVQDASITVPGGATEELSSVLGMFHILNEEFSSVAELESSYGEGNYTVTANTSAGTRTMTLTLGNTALVAAPHVLNLTELQAMDPESDFTLRFSGFQNAGHGDSIFISLSGEETNIFFPDICKGRELPNTATSIVIPAGTFKAGGVYEGSIQFSRMTDMDETLENNFGSAIVSAETKFEFTAGGGTEPSAPSWATPTLNADGTVDFVLHGEPGRSYIIEAASELGAWSTLSTQVAIGGAVTITLDAKLEARTFLRARAL